MQHFILQIAFILIFAVTAVPLFKEERGSEKAAYKFFDKEFVRGGIPHPNPEKAHAKKTAKAA